MEGVQMAEELLELLPLTADETDFNKVFIPLEHDFSLELVNENKLEIYHLRAENRKFNYEDLTEFCVGNLSQYVFSREAVKEQKQMQRFKDYLIKEERILEKLGIMTIKVKVEN